jgi:LytS/YehU family sensor histidine kinase
MPAFIRLIMPSFLFVVLQHSFRSIKQSERLKIENLQLKAENYKAELENLKKQLDPHFLFNSLTTLLTVIRTDTEVAEKYLINLSDVYRSMINKSSVDKVTLQEEIEFIKSYLFLQKTRFESGLNVEINFLEESKAYNLPPFALQLLVENCIKHNILSEKQPLSIKVFQKDPATIAVINNVQHKKKSRESTGTGLQTLIRRYELLGIDNGVDISEDKNNFSVTLKLF